MRNTSISIFGAILSIILLVLYMVTLGNMIWTVIDCEGDSSKFFFAEGITYVLTTIGGLISALVVAQLAITEPGEDPGTHFSRSVHKDNKPQRLTMIIAYVFISAWLVSGLAALVVGVMLYPDANKTISDIGTTWLGLAAAAGYSYFNIGTNQGATE